MDIIMRYFWYEKIKNEKLRDIAEFITETIYKPFYWFRIQKERIERLYSYNKYIWNIGEFEYTWHFGLWAYSLTRLENILQNGDCIYSKKRKRKILTAINILKTLSDWDSYEYYFYEYHYKKWGIPDIYLKDKNEYKLTENQKKLKQKDFKEITKHINKQYQDYCIYLGIILVKHSRHWWN